MGARSVLIVFQFALSFCFIVLLIVFRRQYRNNLNFDYGFNTKNILDVELQGSNPATLSNEFSKLLDVQEISMSSGILGLSHSSTYVHKLPDGDSIEVFQLFVDPRYVGNMGLQLLAGRISQTFRRKGNNISWSTRNFSTPGKSPPPSMHSDRRSLSTENNSR